MFRKKKTRIILSFALTLIMVLSMVQGAFAEGGTVTPQAPTGTSSDPLIVDNNLPVTYGSINPGLPTLDSGWDTAPWIKMTKSIGNPQNNYNTGANFKVLYDENYFYVLTQVFDTKLDVSAGPSYNQDSVEVFFDAMNNKTANRGYTSTDFQFRVSATNTTSFDHGGNNRLISATKTTKDADSNANGYIVESVFYIGDLKQLAGGQQLGFDMQINNGINGNRSGQWFWFDGTGNQWQKPAMFGTIVLSDKPAAVPSRIDKLPLFQNIIAAQKVDPTIYDNSNIITAPLAAAIDMYYNNATATQAQVDTAKKALSDALFALNRPGIWPDPKKLSKIQTLPSLFTFMDGSKVQSDEEWTKRQEEISSLAQYYQYGYRQPAPTLGQETFTRTGNKLNGTLTINGVTKTFSSTIALPANYSKTQYPNGVPIVVSGSGTTYTNAGIATAGFTPTTWSDEAQTAGLYWSFFPFKANDPKFDTSCIMAWAWGYSRVVDGLLAKDANGNPLFPEINPKGICVTGFSINGKFALAAGAFDDRTSVTIPCNSGEGGVANWRYLYNGKYYDPNIYTTWNIDPTAAPGGDRSAQGVYYEYIKNLAGGHPGWFKRIFSDFIEPDQDAAIRLPYDQHSIVALCASKGRSIIIEGGFQDWGTNPQGMDVTFQAARKAWNFLGDPQGIAITFDKGGHGQTAKELTDIVNFINFRVNGIGSFNPSWQTDPYVDYDPTTSPWDAPKRIVNLLRDLTLSTGTLNPSFQSSTLDYSLNVTNSVTTINLTTVLQDPWSTMIINAQSVTGDVISVTSDVISVTSGAKSQDINLAVGKNLISIIVKAQDGTPKTYTVTVNRLPYDFKSVLLAPFKQDGSSTFKAGSVIPVKFQLKDITSHYYADAAAKIYIAKISDGVVGLETEAVASGNSSKGNLCRYDSLENQYIYNFDTSALVSGPYRLRIDLGDGFTYTVSVNLK